MLAPGAEEVDKAFKGRLAATVEALGATGKPDEVTKLPSLGATTAPVVVAVGLGEAASRPATARRRTTPRCCAARPAPRPARWPAPAGSASRCPADDAARRRGGRRGRAARRLRLHALPRHERRAQQAAGRVVHRCISGSGRDKAVKAAVAARARPWPRPSHLARDLVNTPPADLHPADLRGRRGRRGQGGRGQGRGARREGARRRAGTAASSASARARRDPPRLVKLDLHARGAAQAAPRAGRQGHHVRLRRPVAQAGRRHGVTMKCDMGGAAAVIAAITAIARLGLPRQRHRRGPPMAENMPSGTAQRPSDVLTMYGGKTVEVLNTDAEGRLVLADGIVPASEDKPDLIVDVATLTGAQLVALGSGPSAVMSQRRRRCATASSTPPARAGEQMWPMPLPDGAAQASMDSDGRRHRQHRRPLRRHARGRAVPPGVRRRGPALGAPRHRRPGVQRRQAARLHAQGRHRRRACAPSCSSLRTSPPARPEPNGRRLGACPDG